jgi:hypothetical protein
LKSSRSEDIVKYIEVYSEFEEEWWNMALKRSESQDKFQIYSRKRKVLDGFFARILKESRKLPGIRNVLAAYGSAHINPTGKGEVAAPVTATYQSCKRIITTKLVDEYRTTSYGWSGTKKELVFRKIDSNGNIQLGHTPNKYAPVVKNADDRKKILEYNRQTRVKNRHRMGGVIFPEKEDDFRIIRYPEVRGLRFSQDDSMFCDRDCESGLTIGKLLVMEMLGNPRPFPFDRRYKFG